MLIDVAIATARAAGCRRVSLLTDSDNRAAQRLYARHGFMTSGMLTMRLLFPPKGD
jgi:ribosomal protein S18 acetylase RimI-like enzyme